MVVFVDLDDESEPPELGGHWDVRRFGLGNTVSEKEKEEVENVDEEKRDNPNRNASTEALGCYPVVISIASHLDLNTLDALSLTCRQVRANLLQFRTQLLSTTLRCSNEYIQSDPERTLRYRARSADWYFVEVGRNRAGTGKVGQCARDLVGGCRRCGDVICRNCTIKPPAPVLFRYRHRRICTACSRVPLGYLVEQSSEHEHTSSAIAPLSGDNLRRAVCCCATDVVWLCQPCGRSLRSIDSEYESIWKWRTRYLPSLGGLGVGIGEGDRGVPCGRGGDCVAAREVEQEIDCDAEDAREIDSNSRVVSPSSSPGSSLGPGYARHEIEGIGGVVKKKLVRMVKVGACVPEWGDEKEQGKFLVREIEGRARSWCGWCWRVIPGAKDVV
ncbi:hypothetical protein LCER1_G005120 [Lachnellula cervina]|uniref:Uncharacterized protein n=1 Tax=Lachnellula cervina TaxID=1316786 RepID=A0A7D8UUY1_9HELO|nr:hypothetical protein LCER1_G005120 [Lachnellula cervina]